MPSRSETPAGSAVVFVVAPMRWAPVPAVGTATRAIGGAARADPARRSTRAFEPASALHDASVDCDLAGGVQREVLNERQRAAAAMRGPADEDFVDSTGPCACGGILIAGDRPGCRPPPCARPCTGTSTREVTGRGVKARDVCDARSKWIRPGTPDRRLMAGLTRRHSRRRDQKRAPDNHSSRTHDRRSRANAARVEHWASNSRTGHVCLLGRRRRTAL
jgi:hypothetical protein